MIVGFTGTEAGASAYQLQLLGDAIERLPITEFHHGDCIGSDSVAHALIRYLKPSCVIHIHPCYIDAKRAYCYPDVIYPVKAPLVRNADIVAASDILLATPKEASEVVRSGTWATIRHGWSKFGKKSDKVMIFSPVKQGLW